jgi:glycosyltransferase involved in cell wall biosynthesis
MHLIALVESPGHVCCRYRLSAFRPLLAHAGHTLELCPWPRRWWSWFRLGSKLAGADAVILQRKLLHGWQLALLRRAVPLLIYDFDDAVFLRDSYAPRGLYSPGRRRRFAATVRAADAIVAGNAYLAEQAARWTAAGNIHIVPTCVDPALYPLDRPARGNVQLVWVGSPSTLAGLESIRPLLENLGRRLPRLRLKLICSRFFSLRHLPVLPCVWSEAEEAAQIAAADIGISWVPDDFWSRGKCGLKVLQYMAAGLPVVANPVGVQADMVRHGKTGFLATTSAEWIEAVQTLVDDPGLRRRLGQAGRRRVETEFGLAAGAEGWNRLLSQLPRPKGLAA